MRWDAEAELAMSTMPAITDVRNEEELRAYFARLERDYPELVEAMRVMNISYQQYLAALQALHQQSSISTSSAPPIV